MESTGDGLEPSSYTLSGADLSTACNVLSTLSISGNGHEEPQKGLLSFPVELFHEVLSHFPAGLPFPIAPRSTDHPLVEAPLPSSSPRLQRTRALHSLARTCRTLRNFALEYAWEKIEIISVADEKMDNPDTWEEELAQELLRQIEVTTVRNPDLGQRVRTITAIVTSHSQETVTQGLRRCFESFPNLHTVQLLAFADVERQPDSLHYWTTFHNSQLSFPSIKRLALPGFAGVLVKCCPELRVAVATLHPERESDFVDGRTMLSNVLEGCPKVEELAGFPIAWSVDLDRIIVSLPELTTLSINSYNPWDTLPTAEQVSRLRYLPHLRNISLQIADLSERGEPYDPEQLKVVSHCLWMIASSPNSIFPDPAPPLALQSEYDAIASGPKTPRLDYLTYTMQPPHIRNAPEAGHLKSLMPWGVRRSCKPYSSSLIVYSHNWHKFVRFQPTQVPWDPQGMPAKDYFSVQRGKLTQDMFEEIEMLSGRL